MARRTVGARRITFRNVTFRWRATGNDGWISLTIWPTEGRAITCNFGYHQKATPRADGVALLSGQLVITNRIVRRVLVYAIEQHGYEPSGVGQLNLRNIDAMIDLSDAERGR